MIKIDGQEAGLDMTQFHNLEEILLTLLEDEHLQGRIITDVLVNGEPWSEIYPHQARDLPIEKITELEVRSAPQDELAVKMAGELPRVATLMANGGRNVGKLLREEKTAEAMELMQDLLDVTRDFMGMITRLRDQYLGGKDPEFVEKSDKLSDLLTEMGEVMEGEDWVLLSDLLEYEFAPLAEEWRNLGEKTHRQLSEAI